MNEIDYGHINISMTYSIWKKLKFQVSIVMVVTKLVTMRIIISIAMVMIDNTSNEMCTVH